MMKLRQLRLIARHPVYSVRCFRRRMPINNESIELHIAINNLKSKDIETIKDALFTISKLCEKGLNVSAVTDELIKVLKNEDNSLKLEALETLAIMVNNKLDIAKSIPSLEELLQINIGDRISEDIVFRVIMILGEAVRNEKDISATMTGLGRVVHYSKDEYIANEAAYVLRISMESKLNRARALETIKNIRKSNDLEAINAVDSAFILFAQNAWKEKQDSRLMLEALQQNEIKGIKLKAALFFESFSLVANIGPALSALIEMLESGDNNMMYSASIVLKLAAKKGENIGKAAIALINALDYNPYKDDEKIQRHAKTALKESAKNQVSRKETVEALASGALRDFKIRERASEILKELSKEGINISEAISIFIEGLSKTETRKVRSIQMLLKLPFTTEHAKAILTLTKQTEDKQLVRDLAELTTRCVEILNRSVEKAA